MACGAAGSPPRTAQASPVVRDCGVERLAPGEKVKETALDCVWTAYEAGLEAKLTVIGLTNEGDEVPSELHAVPAGLSTLSRDWRADRFSSLSDRVVRTYTCAELVRLAFTSDPAVHFFELTRCTGDGQTARFP